MAATMEAASTVEPAASMKCITAMESAVPVERLSAMESTAATHDWRAMETATVGVSAATIEARSSAIPAVAAVESVEPRTRSNKDASNEVIRPVVAVWRAGVRSISVVAIGACRSRADIPRRHSDSNSNPDLSVGRACPRHNHEKPNQNRIF
jgi:hypothetical protein